jgi:hypothetical protein
MSFWRRIIPAHILIGDINSQPLHIKADQASIQMNLRPTYREAQVMAKDEKTSESVASKAAKLLADPSTPPDVKSVAASALTQAPDKKKK